MGKRIQLQVTADILSDTVFGSGYSIPGGEDIAVIQDENGYPYIPGSTLKGLLRDSLSNWLVWSGGKEEDLNEILGVYGWQGTTSGRRLDITPLTLVDAPRDSADCYVTRTFTSLEDGVAKTGSLRTASCVVKGTQFAGLISCDEDDVDLVQKALRGIVWAGRQRSRGLGRVRFTAKQTAVPEKTQSIVSASCLRYRISTEEPVIVSNLSRSNGNSYETRGLIPGSAIRGMIMSELVENSPEWFQEHRVDLLSEGTRFLDAVPVLGDRAVLPTLLGFYEDKQQTQFESVLKDPDSIIGLKRAGLGSFCSLDGDTIRYWSPETAGTTRIQRNNGSVNSGDNKDTEMFQTRYLCKGQTLEGYIYLENPALAGKIAEVLSGSIRLGADRYQGFGKCKVELLEAVEVPNWVSAYGYHSQDEIGKELYMVVLSPLNMLDANGTPCGIDLDGLGAAIGLKNVKIHLCATTAAEYGGFNRTWQCREPALPMYDRGSVFVLKWKEGEPDLALMRDVELHGLGVRAAEGFGQVLFLRPEIYKQIARKAEVTGETQQNDTKGAVAQERRTRLQWIMNHSSFVHNSGLSRSQLGTIQSLCAKAIAKNGNSQELRDYMTDAKNRSYANKKRYERVQDIIVSVLEDKPSAELAGTGSADTAVARLQLICDLIDHSRKEE